MELRGKLSEKKKRGRNKAAHDKEEKKLEEWKNFY
jgi:hypothetical protein